MILSLGGWSADQGGTEIADSCTSVPQIAAAYEQAITTYNVSRLDMDVEGRSLTNTAGINRRNQAIAMVESWAAANGRPLQFSYTIPTSASGLESTGVAILQNAVANGASIDTVNIMAFDYYDHVTTQMGAAAENAATGAVSQLHSIYPSKTTAQLWGMMGITLMNGIDDYPKKTEVTTVADAQNVEAFAHVQGREHAVDLGDPARQRRLSGQRRRQRLLRDRSEPMGLQPRPGAVHRIVDYAARGRRSLTEYFEDGAVEKQWCRRRPAPLGRAPRGVACRRRDARCGTR